MHSHIYDTDLNVYAVKGAKFKEKDKVIYTNPQGVCFGYRTILNVVLWESEYGREWRYYLKDSDTPWYPVSEDNLRFKARNEPRLIEVRYSNTDIVHVQMSATLTDEEMIDFFKIGKFFDLTNNSYDKGVTVIDSRILI